MAELSQEARIAIDHTCQILKLIEEMPEEGITVSEIANNLEYDKGWGTFGPDLYRKVAEAVKILTDRDVISEEVKTVYRINV